MLENEILRISLEISVIKKEGNLFVDVLTLLKTNVNSKKKKLNYN
jgi:hypothetical protein